MHVVLNFLQDFAIHCKTSRNQCRSVDEYSGEEASFTALALFRSVLLFVGVFLGSFVLGCVMGLLTALVSGGLGWWTWLHIFLVDEILQAKGLSIVGDQYVYHHVLCHLRPGRTDGTDR